MKKTSLSNFKECIKRFKNNYIKGIKLLRGKKNDWDNKKEYLLNYELLSI